MRNWGTRCGEAAVALAVVVAAGGCGNGADMAGEQVPMAETTTSRPPLPPGACVARVSDPSPPQGGTETVYVDSHFPARPVRVVVHYRSKDSAYSGTTDGTGHAEIEFGIGKPTLSHPVSIDVDIDGAEQCSAAFTPRGE